VSCCLYRWIASTFRAQIYWHLSLVDFKNSRCCQQFGVCKLMLVQFTYIFFIQTGQVDTNTLRLIPNYTKSCAIYKIKELNLNYKMYNMAIYFHSNIIFPFFLNGILICYYEKMHFVILNTYFLNYIFFSDL
jgi:hypothetical protein